MGQYIVTHVKFRKELDNYAALDFLLNTACKNFFKPIMFQIGEQKDWPLFERQVLENFTTTNKPDCTKALLNEFDELLKIKTNGQITIYGLLNVMIEKDHNITTVQGLEEIVKKNGMKAEIINENSEKFYLSLMEISYRFTSVKTSFSPKDFMFMSWSNIWIKEQYPETANLNLEKWFQCNYKLAKEFENYLDYTDLDLKGARYWAEQTRLFKKFINLPKFGYLVDKKFLEEIRNAPD